MLYSQAEKYMLFEKYNVYQIERENPTNQDKIYKTKNSIFYLHVVEPEA